MNLPDQIQEALRNNPHGWCSEEKAHVLASCVTAMGGGTVCEIGLYTGRSFLPMALAIKHAGRGNAIGIDAWDGKVAAEGEDEANANWWEKAVPHPTIEQMFRENMAELGVSDICQIIKDDSANVKPPDRIDVLHIDGSHKEKALQDTMRFACNVVIGGFVILDDLSWKGGNVELSVQWLLNNGFVERSRYVGPEEHTKYQNDFACFQKLS